MTTPSRILTPDHPNDEDGADYTLRPTCAGVWITYRGVVVHIFTPFGSPAVAVEAFPVGVDVDDDTQLGEIFFERPCSLCAAGAPPHEHSEARRKA